MLKTMRKTFLETSLYLDEYQKLISLFLVEDQPPSKFCAKPFSSFCAIMPTNKPTNQHQRQKTTWLKTHGAP